MVTIVGRPNSCQVVRVINYPAAIGGAIANPPDRIAPVAANSSAAPMANASGPSITPDWSLENIKDGNQFWLTG
jgi:hypothetical protein